jgi:hypothetical protein
MGCKVAITSRIRRWIIDEEIRRSAHDPIRFEINAGYLLALSNLIELLYQIEIEVDVEGADD